MAHVFPDDRERLETSETFATVYSVPVVDLARGDTEPMYARPTPGQNFLVQKPVAYAAFADNGNIQIWSDDPIQVQTLREHGHDLKPPCI